VVSKALIILLLTAVFVPTLKNKDAAEGLVLV
jgi:hypothetical protein